VGSSTSAKELDELFKQLNVSGTGRISFDEFWKWWSDTSAAQSRKLSEIRIGLLRARGKAMLRRGVSAAMSKIQADAGATRMLFNGPVTDAKMAFTLNISPSHAPLAPVFAKKPDTAFAIAVDFDVVPQNAAYAEAVLQIATVALQCNAPAGLVASVEHREPGLLRLLLVAACEAAHQTVDTVLGVGPLTFQLAAKAGWDLETLADRDFEVPLRELLNAEVTATLGALPLAPEDVLGPVVAALAGLGISEDAIAAACPIEAAVDAGVFPPELDFSAATATINLSDDEEYDTWVHADADTHLAAAIEEIAHGLATHAPPALKAFGPMIAGLGKCIALNLKRDFRGVRGVHMELRASDGGAALGCSLDNAGVLSTESLARFISSFSQLAATLIESVPFGEGDDADLAALMADLEIGEEEPDCDESPCE
jgi:hypothetical protein